MTWTAFLAPCRPLNLLLPPRKTSGSIFPINPRKTLLRNYHPGINLHLLLLLLRRRAGAARPSILPARCPRRCSCKTLPRSLRMIPPSPSLLPKILGRVKEGPRRPLRRPPTARWFHRPARAAPAVRAVSWAVLRCGPGDPPALPCPALDVCPAQPCVLSFPVSFPELPGGSEHPRSCSSHP